MPLRPLVLASVCVLTFSCSHLKQAVFIDPALATLTPPDTTLLVGARLDKLRESDTYQRHFSDTHFPALDRFAKETGLDPKKDLWEVLFASNGSTSVIMARGRFSPTDLEPKIQRDGATRTPYRGYTLIGDENSSIFFMNQTTALAGSTPTLMRMIDRQNDGLSYGIPGSLKALVATLPPDSQFWAAFTGNTARLPVPDSSNLGNLNSLIRTVASGTFAADLRQGLKARAAVTCVSDADAKQTSDSLTGLLAIGRAASSKKADVVRAFDTIHVSHNQRDVEISVDAPQDLVDRVVNTFGK